MTRVLVTRPEPADRRTAERLGALGFTPVVLPLTRIEPLAVAEWPTGAVAVAVSSANAVRHAPPRLLEAIAGLPVYAVGARTGEAARQAGLVMADEGAGDAQNLVRRVADALPAGTEVLVLCGRVRRDTLERGLLEARLDPKLVETYDTLPLSPSQAEVAAALGRASIDAVLLHSAFAAEVFARLATSEPLGRAVEGASCIAISRRVAERLPAPWRARALVAAEPNEAAMLSLLAAGI